MKTLVVGLQYGDEGKGRVSAYFAKDHDWSIRFNGGNNAGHTVVDGEGKIHKFHHLPAGAAFGKKVALDAGMVIDLKGLREEIRELGKPVDLYISDSVHLIQPEHIKQDSKGSGVGSTKKGMAYVYADRALRKGQRVESLQSGITNCVGKATYYRGLPPVGTNESALYEGAQGIMLDIDYGCYPYVTSSSMMPNSAHRINKTIGVMKAYVSRVGDGPPNNPDVPELRVVGQEFGTTTGRPRQCTWLDLRDLDYALSIVQPDEIVVTKLDVLKSMQPHMYDREGKEIVFKSAEKYETFLLDTYPQIKWFSRAAGGDLIKVR